MTDLVDRLLRRAEILEALGDTNNDGRRRKAWQIESSASMRQAATDNKQAAFEITTLRSRAEKAEAERAWQPMETSPDKGVIIGLMDDGCGSCWAVDLYIGGHHGEKRFYHGSALNSGSYIRQHPRAWMPWPQPCATQTGNATSIDPSYSDAATIEEELDAAIARAEAAEARVKALERAVQMVMTWGEQRCPCKNEEPNPCPLCGASVENLEPCKSAENTFPPHLLFEMRRALGLRAALAQPADDVEAAPVDDGWIPWTGGECPVDGDANIRVKYRIGQQITAQAKKFFWAHVGDSIDIMAYRVEAAP